MRLRKVITGIAMIIFLLASTGTMAAGWGDGGARVRVGKGVKGDDGGGICLRYLHRSGLDLTHEQEEQILALHQEFHRKSLALRQRLQRLRLELRRLWAEEKPDATAINKKLTEMTPLKIELRAMALETWEEIRKVLTPEQLKRLESTGGRVLLRRKGKR
ncbi:MAG: periplasmic heavy metal sensor [Firmicutes bacterium]|jgi:Spy/CpxP family protein refolding chaperone|nr:periplasmic heavy metal sensor [Bacillota bacterium]